MAIGDVVQSGSASISAGHTATIGATPTEGNTLVIGIGFRQDTHTSTPNGFTSITGYVDHFADSNQPYRIAGWFRHVEAGDTATISFTETGTSERRIQYVELEGALAVDTFDTEATNDEGCSSPWGPLTLGTLTAGTGAIALVGMLVGRSNVNVALSGTVVAPATEIADTYGSSRVPMWSGYRKIDPAAGSYDMQVTLAGGGCLRGQVSFLVSFDIEDEDPDPPDPPDLPEPGIWMDWDHDGFGDGTAGSPDPRLVRMLPQEAVGGSGISDNVTTYVLGSQHDITGRRPGSANHIDQPQPETYTFFLKNTDGRFTPTNVASPFYGKVKPGVPVWGGVNEDGTLSGTGQAVYGFMAGYVREFVPIPLPGATHAPWVEVLVDGPMANWRRRRARVEFEEGRTYAEYRGAILDSIGEPATRRDLGYEADKLAFSGNSNSKRGRIAPVTGSRDQFTLTTVPDFRLPETRTDPVALLEALNLATGARHFVQPADTKELWYLYTTVPRTHNLDADVADSWFGTDTTAIAGFRLSDEAILNVQEITFSQVHSTLSPVTVWEYGDVPFALTSTANRTIVADLGDFVIDAELDIAYSGSLVSSTFTNYGTGAVILVGSAGSSQVTALKIRGRRISRDSAQVIERSASGISPINERLAPSINTDYLQSQGLAEGRAAFTPWKFERALARPSAEFVRDFATTLRRHLYDVVDLTVAQLALTTLRSEITAIDFRATIAASAEVSDWRHTFELQETSNPDPLDLFVLDVSMLDGTDLLAP